MKCPVCKVPTYAVEHDQIELDLCAQCAGVWFDAGELDLLVGDGTTVQSAGKVTEKGRDCPICRARMDKVNIGPGGRVLIDSCPDGCGLWFDAHEVSELTIDLAADGWQVAPDVRRFLGEMFPQKGEETC